MVWIYLAASEACQLPSQNGLAQSPIAKSIPIVKESYYPEWPMENWQKHQYGMILRLCLDIPLEKKKLILSMEDSHARTLALLALEKAWKASEVASRMNCCDWLKKLNPSLFSLKTFPILFHWGQKNSLKNFTRWGWTQDGVAYLPIIVVPLIKEIDGLFYPTLTASQAGKPIRKPSPSRLLKKHGYDLQDYLGEICPNLIGKKINPHFMEWMMGFPLYWTELKPWATAWFRIKQKKHLKY